MFQKGAMGFLVSMLLKLFQRRTLSSFFLRCVSNFHPNILSDLSKLKLQAHFKYLLNYLIEMHVLVTKTCDQAVTEFRNFLDNEMKKQQIEFFGFKVENK